MDAERTLVFVVVMPALAVERDAPRDEDALSTFVFVLVIVVLTPAIDEPKDEDAPSTVPLTVVIWLESEVDAPVTKLLVPVIAERMDDVAVPIRVSVLVLTLV